MSKYDPLWQAIAREDTEHVRKTFQEIAEILGFPIDHSFLRYKAELKNYGYTVEKVSMKQENVLFAKCPKVPEE